MKPIEKNAKYLGTHAGRKQVISSKDGNPTALWHGVHVNLPRIGKV